MTIEEQTQFVIDEMRRYHKTNDIIYALCEKTGRQWNETAAFVNQVIAENQTRVQDERKPLIAAIGVAVIVAGLGVIAADLIATLDGWIVMWLYIPYSGNILAFLFGLMLVVGGLQGLLQMALFDRKPGQ